MEGCSGLLLMLMLTGAFVASDPYSPPTSGYPSLPMLSKERKSLKQVMLVQGMSLRIMAFCAYKYLQGDKIWCKEKQQKECDLKGPLSHSGSGWKYLTNQPNQKIMLERPTNGCISLLMTNLQVEDSGIYWFGLLEGLEIVSSNKIKVVVHEGHFVPSKIFSSPASTIPSFKRSSEPGRRVEEVMKVQALQVEDSGIYWFGILDGLHIIPLRKIKVIVQKEQQKNGIVTAISENEQRIYQIVLVLSSIMVGITIIAALVLVVTKIIKRKSRADDLNFGDNPNCRVIALQIRESNAANNPVGKEMEPVYAILKKPKSIEDVTYINMKFPLRSNLIKHRNEPTDAFSPSGSVKYANISFESQVSYIGE
ncbi:uncharacterized protein LOC134393943 isoform X6 [Elgaria multicarinata webbii]|uniref:uncharacterized protein LOC134393943 isoform X6 n=1 Tax=Elgaria multicarinata webbii TaxID=159646 RepID=UPI002FCD52DC